MKFPTFRSLVLAGCLLTSTFTHGSDNATRFQNYFNTIPGGSLPTGLSNFSTIVGGLSTADALAAFNQIQPSKFGDLTFQAHNNIALQHSIIARHLLTRRIHAPSKGYGGYWGQAYGAFQNQDTRDSIIGYDDNMGGVIGGVDYSVNIHYSLGFALGLSRSKLDWCNNEGNATTDSYYALFYNHLRCQHFYIEGMVSFGTNNFTAKRNINLQTISTFSEHDHDANVLAARLGVGTEYGLTDCTDLKIFASGDASHLREKALLEKGSDFNLTLDRHFSYYFRGEAGIQLSTNFEQDYYNLKLVPAIKCSYIGVFPYKGSDISGAFADAAIVDVNRFTVLGRNKNTYLISPGASITGFWSNKVHFNLYYDSEIGDNYYTHEVGIRGSAHF